MVRNSTNVRNSGWNLANILIYPVAFLAATPFFIDNLTENVFGEWMLINSYVFIAVHIIGFGLPDSITAHVAQAVGQNNNEKLNAYINVSVRLLGRMALLTLLFAIVLTTLFTQEMLTKGYLAWNQFKPSYAHQTDHVEEYLVAVRSTFMSLAESLAKGDLSQQLHGPPARRGFYRLT